MMPCRIRTVRPSHLSLMLLCLAAGLAPCSGAGAEEPGDEPPQDSIFGESVAVHIVNVDVRVTDRRGRPISGLDAADFTLREDGERVEITHFSEIPPVAPPAAGSGSPGSRVVKQEDGLLVFLFDDLSLPAAARRRALEDLGHLVGGGLDTFTAVAVTDGELEVVAQPTIDPAIIQSAFEQIAAPSPRGLARQREREAYLRDVLAEVGHTVQEVGAGVIEVQEGVRYLNNLSRQVEGEANRRRDENRASLAGVASLLDALAPIRGRKAVVFVTGGIEMRPGQAELDIIQQALAGFAIPSGSGGQSFRSQDSLDARSAALGALTDQAPRQSYRRRKKMGPPDELGGLAALAAHAGVSFYPWRAHGDLGVAGAEIGGEAALASSPSVRRSLEDSFNDSLGFLAERTGGEFAVGSGLTGLVEEAREDFGGYYSLAFSPEHGGDDRLHELEVKVRGRSLRVWHPETYLARPPD